MNLVWSRIAIVFVALVAGARSPSISAAETDSQQSRLDAIRAMQAGNDQVRVRHKTGFAIPRFRGVLQQEWIVVDPSSVQFRDVKLDEMGIKNLDSILTVESNIHRYAKTQGFATGVWTGHQALDGGKRVIGVYFIRTDACSVEQLTLPGLRGSTDWCVVVSEVNRQATLSRPQMVGGFPVKYLGKDKYEVVFLNEAHAAVVID